MALILSTERDLPLDLSPEEVWQVYNGLDCAITSQAYSGLLPLLRKETGEVYNFQMECQVMALEMMTRGLRVDPIAKAEAIKRLEFYETKLSKMIDRYGLAVWKKPLNPNSHQQLKALFYDYMGLPVQYKFEKGERKPTTNRDALEKLIHYYDACPILLAIMAFKDNAELLKVLRKPLDHDGRMRFSLNVGATETGRWSSSKHPLGSGTNGQNITDEVRRIFTSDPGYIFINLDLVTAESLGVAYLSGDIDYLRACESGDLHTQVAKLVWPNRPWTGNLKEDRALADEVFYRHFSYRDMAKRGGHLTNYLGTAKTMAMHLRLPISVCQDFQALYFRAFPRLAQWHIEVQAELQTTRRLITPLGRIRQFFGRSDSHDTLKEAIAYVPQSTIVDCINRGALQLWKKEKATQFLLQVHDSVLLQQPVNRVEEALTFAKTMDVAVPVRNQIMHIPIELSAGWNWGKRLWNKETKSFENPNGLRKVNGPELLELARQLPALDRGYREPVHLP